MAEARSLRAQLRADPPAATANSRLTVRQYADEWLETYQGRTARGIRPETVDGYRVALERHVLPELGETRLAELTPQDIKRVARQLERTHKPSSVRRTLSPLRALLADAAEEGVIRVSPFTSVRLPSDTARPVDERVKALTDAEAAGLIAASPPGQDRLLIRVLLATGLRTGEVLALRWGDIDPRRINVCRAVSRAGTIGPPKSRAGTRMVSIPASLARDLLHLRTATSHSADEDIVFCSSSGRPRDAKNFANRTFARAARAAGIPWATPHVLRHTYASRMIREGCNVKQLQALLGHATIGVTLDTYAHLFEDDLPPALPEPVVADHHGHSKAIDQLRPTTPQVARMSSRTA